MQIEVITGNWSIVGCIFCQTCDACKIQPVDTRPFTAVGVAGDLDHIAGVELLVGEGEGDAVGVGHDTAAGGILIHDQRVEQHAIDTDFDVARAIVLIMGDERQVIHPIGLIECVGEHA